MGLGEDAFFEAAGRVGSPNEQVFSRENAILTISGKALGRKKPLFADFSVSVPPNVGSDGGGATLRDLIGHVVRAEVAAFRERQEERTFLKALTQREIAASLARGKVDMGGKDLRQEVDAEEAVAVALLAFQDGLYLVVLDGEEQKDLDQPVYLNDESKVAFVRLTMLAGG